MFNTVDILITISMLVLMLVPGFVLTKLKMVKAEALATLSAILLYVCQPFLSFKVFALANIDNPTSIVANIAIMMLIAFVTMIIGFIIAKLTFFKFKDVERAKIYTFASTFGNIGFIGIPIISGISGGNPIALIYTAIFIVIFNLLLWTLGIYIITGDIKSVKPLKILFNPPTLAFFLSLPFFFFPQINIFKMHSAVSSFVSLIGDMTTPLSMVIVGIRLGFIPFKEIFTLWHGYIMVALKQIIIPLVCFALLYPFARFGIFKGAGAEYIVPIAVVLSALPTAASTIALCERFKGDAVTSTKTFLQSTILSIVTLPVLLLVLLLL